MREPLQDFYRLLDIHRYANVYLLELSEQCAALEEKVYEIAEALPAEQRQIVQAYILARNDLDVETLTAALRWGKQHYK